MENKIWKQLTDRFMAFSSGGFRNDQILIYKCVHMYVFVTFILQTEVLISSTGKSSNTGWLPRLAPA